MVDEVQGTGTQPRQGLQVPKFLQQAVPVEPREMGIGIAPGLPRRAVAAGEGDRDEAGEAVEPPVIGGEELAAPERAVGAKAEPVEGDPESSVRVVPRRLPVSSRPGRQVTGRPATVSAMLRLSAVKPSAPSGR